MARRSTWFEFWRLLLLLESVLGFVVRSEDSIDDLQTTPRSSLLKATLLQDQDPFYKAPAGFEKSPLGAILQHLNVPNNITLKNVDPIKVKDAWQLL
jgi:hypothetical protein